MAQTYAQLAKQIAALQAKAEKQKQQEVKDVIAKIKAAIDAYGITAKELFGKAGAGEGKAAKTKARSSGAPKYSDGSGNVWVGRGPRPQWLRDALASGKQLTDFLFSGDENASDASPVAKSKKTAAKRSGAKKRSGRKKAAAKKTSTVNAQYTDGTNAWGGRGPHPRWLKEAVAAGRSLDELRVQ